ncbi:hypothetical protein H4S01_004431 [Coemansia sp. RSA 2610]|nr:hypothetical protein H4S01_004431 [Coemansia sp. RSA 2610]
MPPKRSTKQSAKQSTTTLDRFFTRTPASARSRPEPSDVAMLSDSDSDDGLVDAAGLLGTPEPARRQPSVQPRATPYRNSLKSLVRASQRQKFQLGFLDEHVGRSSSDEDEDAADLAGRDAASIARALAGSAMSPPADVVEQLGSSDGDAAHTHTRVSLFRRAGRLAFDDTALDDIAFDDIAFAAADPVERLCAQHASDARFVCALAASPWLAARAHSGWKLTQGVGDVLLRVACLARDARAAAGARRTLLAFLDLQLAAWELRLPALLALAGALQGALRTAAVDADDSERNSDGDSDASSDVVVEIAAPGALAAARTRAQRMAALAEVAARALEFLGADDSCRAVELLAAALLDHGAHACRARMQRALARLVAGVAPPSKWALVWPACAARLARLVAGLPLRAQLRAVDALPAQGARCQQLRRGLALVSLRLQTPDWLMAAPSAAALAAAAALPPPVAVRVAAELLADDDGPFRVAEHADFARLEAAVGLLAHVLHVPAMRAAPADARALHRHLGAIARRISERAADRIDRTRAKDAVQTLRVRVFMTAM